MLFGSQLVLDYLLEAGRHILRQGLKTSIDFLKTGIDFIEARINFCETGVEFPGGKPFVLYQSVKTACQLL